MSDSEIIIPLEFVRLVDERDRIRYEYSQSSKQIERLNNLSRQVPPISTPSNSQVGQLADGTPPAELMAVIANLEQQQPKIRQLEREVEEYSRRLHDLSIQKPLSRPEPLNNRAIVSIIVVVIAILIIGLFCILSHPY